MNKIRTASLLAILFLSFCSCGNKPYPNAMNRADSIVSEYPDSAFIILQEIGKDIYTYPQDTRMYYYLLYTKAKDKAYIPHTTDKLMQIVVQYYERKKDSKHLPEAYYYTGCIYRDLGDAPQALDYFKKSLEASKGSTDYKVVSLIYSQIGTLYLFQDVYDAAMEAFRKAYNYNLLAKDSVRIVYNLRDIGDTFTAFNQADSALHYYQTAYLQAKHVKNKSLMDVTQYGLASLYIQLHQYAKAKETLQSTSPNPKRGYLSSLYSISADMYYQLGNMDSASYYYNRLLSLGTIYAKQAAHWGLAEIAQKQGNCDIAIDQLRQYNAYTDSIRKITETESIRKMHALYNYQLREQDNSRLKTENTHQKLWIAYSLAVILILVAAITIYVLYNKYRQQQLKETLDKLKRVKENQYRLSNQYIADNKRLIVELKQKLQNTNAEKDKMQRELLELQKEQAEQENVNISLQLREKELLEYELKQSDIYLLFHNATIDSSIKIAESDWQALQEALNDTYADFTKRLKALHSINIIEEHVCLLIKIGFTPSGITHLVPLSKQGISSIRKRLYCKIHGESGKPEDFDKFIRSF